MAEAAFGDWRAPDTQTELGPWWVWWGRRFAPGLDLWTMLFLQAAHRLVCAHLPDGEAEEEPEPQPGRGGGHPAGHPEGRAPRHPGAAEGRVRAAPERGQKWGLEREAGQSVPDRRAGSLARWVLMPACHWE